MSSQDQALSNPLVHSRTTKLLCAIPIFTLWLFGIAVFCMLNTRA